MKRKRILYLIALLILGILIASCKKNLGYDVNTLSAEPPNANKKKLKTEEQYVSILHANLFQKALSANELVEIVNVIMSVGDKDLVHEMIISNFMNKPEVILPSDAEMRADIDGFIDKVYDRFLVRPPSQAEKTWFRNFIEAYPNLSAELVYFAFALCNEYLYY